MVDPAIAKAQRRGNATANPGTMAARVQQVSILFETLLWSAVLQCWHVELDMWVGVKHSRG